MGLCGCKLAANDPNPGSVSVIISSTKMGAQLPQMLIPSVEVTVVFLPDHHAPPYAVDGLNYNSSEDVGVGDGFRGRFIGVNQISAVG
ncbi:hypothetical protein [Rhodanobacter sp. UC4436_H3]